MKSLAILWARWFCKFNFRSDIGRLCTRLYAPFDNGYARKPCVGWHCKGCPKGNK